MQRIKIKDIMSRMYPTPRSVINYLSAISLSAHPESSVASEELHTRPLKRYI